MSSGVEESMGSFFGVPEAPEVEYEEPSKELVNATHPALAEQRKLS